MVENRPWVNFIAHFTLIAGVLVVAFPLYITFIASTLTLDQINQVPMQLTPGSAMWDNYSQVLTAGSTRGSSAPVGQMMTNSLIMALVIAIGKIADKFDHAAADGVQHLPLLADAIEQTVGLVDQIVDRPQGDVEFIVRQVGEQDAVADGAMRAVRSSSPGRIGPDGLLLHSGPRAP